MANTTETSDGRTAAGARAAHPMRRMALFGAMAALGAAFVLSGCTADPTPTPDPSATSKAEVTKVDDDALGEALVKLAFQGEAVDVADNGECLVDAVRDAGMSEAGLTYIVETSGDDLGAVATGLLKVETGDANLLLSPQLRTAFDACVDAAILSSDAAVDPATTYEPAADVTSSTQPAPNLTPAVVVDANRDLNSSTLLVPGVTSMFASFAQNDEQVALYTAASECLSRAIYDAGFSQDAMRFIAGGAPLGSGSIAEHLPTEEDRELWASPSFTQVMVDCTTLAKVDDAEEG